MAGLREKQKADRTRRILETALHLFREQGYDAVRIEAIAAAAEVSVGTCYNYFATKGDLLLAIVSMEVEEVVEAGRALVADPPPDIAAALDGLIGLYYDHSLHYLTKEMWRAAMALSVGAPGTPFSARYTALDGMLLAQVSDLVAELQRRGLARTDLEARTAAEIVFHNLNQMFMEFVKLDTMSLADLRAAVRRQNAALAGLMAA